MKKIIFILFQIVGFTLLAQNSNNDAKPSLFDRYKVSFEEAKAGSTELQVHLSNVLWRDAIQAKKEGRDNDAQLLFDEANKLALLAAKSGSPAGQYAIGTAYERGEGYKINYKKALHWYRLAADQDYFLAKYEIGKMYEFGLGLNIDYNKAIDIYNSIIIKVEKDSIHLADDWDAYHMTNKRMGGVYENGKGVPIDYGKAMACYLKSGDHFLIGNKYFEGVIVPQDYKKANEYYAKSANIPSDYTVWDLSQFDDYRLGSDSALYMLGYMNELGLGVAQNKDKAIQLYRFAAQKGHLEAKNRMLKLQSKTTDNDLLTRPTIHILSPENGSFYENNTLEFKIYTSDNVKVYVEINGAKAVEVKQSNSKGSRIAKSDLYIVENLPNVPGKKVNLCFFARDNSGLESDRQRITLQNVGKIIKPQLHIFAVGISDYTSGDISKLRYAAKDALDFVNAIENTDLNDYENISKHILINQQATRMQIYDELTKLLNSSRPDDVVIFYFSGHGILDKTETYFMTVNSSSVTPYVEGVNFSDLRNIMRKLTEQQVKVVSFMDACHAGAMVGSKGAAPKLTELDVQNVIEFYSSTTGEESAEDEKLQNGVFTAGLISGLKGAAANADGYITVNTLRTYLSDYVRNKNSRQTPVFKGVDAGDITLFHKK